MTNPYTLWDTRRSLGVMREVDPIPLRYLPLYEAEVLSDDDWIDFTKLPAKSRKMAAFVMPLSRGKPIYEDAETTTRFKPAYVKAEDQIDELLPLQRQAGLEAPLVDLDVNELTPEQRLNALRTQMTSSHVEAIWRTWEWMAARATIDGKLTIVGENYPETLIDFNRDPSHTVVLEAGSRLGDPGVSTIDFIQSICDRMNNAKFGGVPVIIEIGNDVWQVLRKDAEFMDHMDTNKRGGNITVERGLVSSERVFKAGELMVGGASGQTIELWVNNEVYEDVNGVEHRILGSREMHFRGSASALRGVRCFGRIIDRKAKYKALPIFPKNWVIENDTTTEYLTHKSAPLMVPINPNTTAKIIDAVPEQ